jgi:hypothetical protein
MAVCWYTRDHQPARAMHPREDHQPIYARCCHCHRDIVSLDARHWSIVGAFDAEAAGRRRIHAFLSVVDTLDEVVLARFPIGSVPDERGVAALRIYLRWRYRLDDPGCTLDLRDSRDH